ncbi:hypothetical protein AVEN_247877-1 [Araneus ventricosus]|uniref:Uncharacterized protein n=1 Tax=Araneus ventricosus TaxID=182803 RepID=A0A4Y2IVB2_ARAVE|nr:hypothetical protein AVEN_247877-1 [Araneus ventricosus]
MLYKKRTTCMSNFILAAISVNQSSFNRFGYEIVSSVGEFTTLSYRTTVLRQSSRLTTYARSVAGHIEIRNLACPGLEAVEVSYLRVRLTYLSHLSSLTRYSMRVAAPSVGDGHKSHTTGSWNIEF